MGFRVFRVGFRVFRVGFRVFRVGFRVFRVGSGCSGWGSGFYRHPKLTVLTETHADCIKKYNLIYYTVKPQAVFLVCPSGGLYTKLTKEYNIN